MMRFRFIGKHLKTISRICLLLPLLGLSFSSFAEEDLLASLQAQAEQYVYSQLIIDPTSQVEVTANQIDTRHQLHECTGHLAISLAGSGAIKRSTTVKLHCDSTPEWELLVPVRIKVLRPFVTVNEAITKETVLDSSNLKLDFMDEVMMRGDSFDSIEILLGSRSKRDLRPGQPVRSNQICVVCKGDSVEILADTGRITIRTTGIAQQDGSFNQQIKVENSRSHKMISAKVVAVGKVQVGM
jgi:flagella basal body P-ring formation protein FlgA